MSAMIARSLLLALPLVLCVPGAVAAQDNTAHPTSAPEGQTGTPDASAGGHFVTNPRWLRPPRPIFPPLADINNVPYGRVVLSCLVHPDGTLSGCEVLEETPVGQGFGESALAAARDARLVSRDTDPVVLGRRVVFPIVYRLPAG